MTSPWRAGHLPGVAPSSVHWTSQTFSAPGGQVCVELPRLNDATLTALATRVRAGARAVLRPLSVDEIIAIIDRAVARLLDAQDPLRREADALLPVVTGYDAEMVCLGLTAYLESFRAAPLRRFVAQDFPNPKVLDGFQPAVKGGSVRALGAALLTHVWAGNVPGLPLWSLVCGLLVKAGNIGKLPTAEPVFATLAARALIAAHPPLADALAVVWWPGAEPDAGQPLYRASETVLAYGSNASLAEVRARVPITTRFLGYGHKLGVSLIGRAALDRARGPAQARRAALDVVRWEQQGCYSPHLIYVEKGGALSPRVFAQHLAAELANLGARHPRRVPTLDEAAQIAAWRQAAEWREAGEGGAVLLGDEHTDWAVAFQDAPLPLQPTAGYRCVQVCAVDALGDVPPLLAPYAEVLQSVALATDPASLYPLAQALGAAGVTRIAALGHLAQPEAGWHHDGRFNLLDLVRMVEIEQSTETACDRLAAYRQEGAA